MLLAPLRYWKVHHPRKRQWDFLFPALGAMVLTGTVAFWPGIGSPYDKDGYMSGLQAVYPIIGGFFVAALTLVATTETEALKQRMIGTPSVTYGSENHPMERRRFLSLLFGYLAFSSFGLYAVGFIADLLAPGMQQIVPQAVQRALSSAFLIAYNFWLVHVIIATMVGLYYFTDRLQRPDPQAEQHPGSNFPPR